MPRRIQNFDFPSSRRELNEEGDALTQPPLPDVHGLKVEDHPDFVDPSFVYHLIEDEHRRVRLVDVSKDRDTEQMYPEDRYSYQSSTWRRVDNTFEWPYRANGSIISTFPDGNKYAGTGTLIGNLQVLTAGHNVFSIRNGGWARAIQFTAAHDEGKNLGKAFAVRACVISDWTSQQVPERSPELDMAVFLLNNNVGNGYFLASWVPDPLLQLQTITLAGYPKAMGGRQLWETTGRITQVNNEKVVYDAFTLAGLSGAAVFSTFNSQYYHACATHVSGPNGVPNYGCRISQERHAWLMGDQTGV